MRYFLLLSIGMLAFAFNAKGQSFNATSDDFDYVPGDLIVKFKETSPIAPNINKAFSSKLKVTQKYLRSLSYQLITTFLLGVPRYLSE